VKRLGGWPATFLFVACSLTGGILAPTLAVGWASGDPPSLLKAIDFAFGGGAPSPLDAFGVVAAAAGGMLLGGFAAIFLVRRSSPGFDCPFCGTRNQIDAVECPSCGNRFR